jgi:cytochrome c-type biogenesis protein CcmH/NrfG
MENQTAETTTEASSASQQQAQSAKRTSKWLMIGVPVAVIAAFAYGYNTGYLQQAAGYVQQAAGKASTTIASYVPGSKLHTSSVKDQLVGAREAFAAGDMKAAIEGYQAVIARNPGDMAARGELGNVYYAVGATNEAAQAYFETAKLAIEQNQLEVAEALMPVVSEGNPMLADQLMDKLFEAQRTTMSKSDMGGQPWNDQQPNMQPQQYGPQQGGPEFGGPQQGGPQFDGPQFGGPQFGPQYGQPPYYGPQQG